MELELKLSGLSVVTDIQSVDDDRLFVAERRGTVNVFQLDEGGSFLSGTTFLDISARVRSGGESGLLGMAFHPEYATNGYFFVNYISRASGNTIIARFSTSPSDPNDAEEDSELIIAEIEQPQGNHNGGQISFHGGYLYIGTGDGGGGNDPYRAGQDLSTLLGKILRVDIDNMNEATTSLPIWNIPPDNPFLELSSPYNAIWAYGLRNPWRFSFDRVTGDLWIGDVGQHRLEEIDFQPASSTGGENYGWGLCEGTRENTEYQGMLSEGCSCEDTSCFVPPVLEYNHSEGYSVTGGYVYRGVEYTSQLNGTYFYADYGRGNLWGARQTSDGIWENVITTWSSLMGRPTTFGENRHGELYVGTFDGEVFRVNALGLPTRAPTASAAPSETPMSTPAPVPVPSVAPTEGPSLAPSALSPLAPSRDTMAPLTPTPAPVSLEPSTSPSEPMPTSTSVAVRLRTFSLKQIVLAGAMAFIVLSIR